MSPTAPPARFPRLSSLALLLGAFLLLSGAAGVRGQSGHTHTFASETTEIYLEAPEVGTGQGPVTGPVLPGAVLTIGKKVDYTDWDYCTNTDGLCTLPAMFGKAHVMYESDVAWQTYATDETGGKFGKLVNGVFAELPATDVANITHYKVDTSHATRDIHLTVSAKDTGLGKDSNGQPVTMKLDGGTCTSPARLVQVQGDDPKTKGSLKSDHCCSCQLDKSKVKAKSEVVPATGTVTFDVPMASWSSHGASYGFALAYNSSSTADPTLTAWDSTLTRVADFAHLGGLDSHWTHTFAQSVEVVDAEDGEHAIWHTGTGGVTGFHHDLTSDTWTPEGSFLSMSVTKTYISDTVTKGGVTFTATVPYSKFEVTDAEGTVYSFSQVYWQEGIWVAIPHFLLKTVTDRWGRVLTLAWTGDRLNSVTDDAAQVLSFSYDASNQLASVSDPQGRTHTISYGSYPDQYGNLRRRIGGATVWGPGSPTRTKYVWSFGYGSPTDPLPYGGADGTYTGDLVVTKTDPLQGITVNYAYEKVTLDPDPAKNRQNVEDWEGRMTSCSYSDAAEGGTIKTLSREGSTLIYPEGNRVTFGYSDEDLISVTDEETSRSINQEFDEWHNVLRVWANQNEASPLVVNDYGHKLDALGAKLPRILQVTSTGRGGEQTTTTYGVQTDPDWPMVPTKQTSTAVAPHAAYPYTKQITWLYDAAKNPTSITSGDTGTLTDTTTFSGYSYDEPQTVTESVGRAWGTTYDSITGLPRTSSSPVNLLVPVTDPDRNASVTTVAYNSDELPATFTDGLNRQVTVTYTANAGSQALLDVKYTRVVDGASRTVTLDAGGRPVQMTDEAGTVTFVKYNGDGKPLYVTEAYGTAEARTTLFSYNKNGDLLSITPPRGTTGKVLFEYTRYDQYGTGTPSIYEGQVTKITHPDLTCEFFVYDDEGRLKYETKGKMVNGSPVILSTVEYSPDDANRTYTVHYPATAAGTLPNLAPSQAAFDVTTVLDEFGRPLTTTDSTGTTSYSFDALDRISALTGSGGRKGLTRAYFRDTVNKRWYWTTTLAGGTGTWTELEDSKGRVCQVKNALSQFFNIYYNALGQPVKHTYPTGAWTDYTYDTAERLQSLTMRLSNGNLLDQLRYTYTATGQVASEIDAGNRTHGFEYNLRGELKKETHPDLGTGIVYEYDADGNRTKVIRNGVNEFYGYDLGSPGVPGNPDKLLWTNGTNAAPTAGQAGPYNLFSYDEFGNLARRDRKDAAGNRKIVDFAWDANGRLRQALDESTSASLLTATYAGDGDRITKTDSVTGNHTYSYGLYDSYQQTYYTPRFQQRQSVQGPDRFFHTDWLGSTRYITNQTGTAAPAMLRYDAYGNRSAWQGTDLAHPTDYQWGGAQGYMREADTSLGLDYLYQRYYDPSIGRFISRDPIRWGGGVNLYGYCGGDPVNRVDPSGLDPGPMTQDEAAAIGKAYGPINDWLEYNVRQNPTAMGAIGFALGLLATEGNPFGGMAGAGLLAGSAEHRRGGSIQSTIGTAAGAACAAAGAIQVGQGLSVLASSVRLPRNPILGLPRVGSGLKNDFVRPRYGPGGVMIKEFPGTAKGHGFPDIVDNWANLAVGFRKGGGAMLYQLPGSYNGVDGRFEWIVQGGQVTHRMFVGGGTINGIPIRP